MRLPMAKFRAILVCGGLIGIFLIMYHITVKISSAMSIHSNDSTDVTVEEYLLTNSAENATWTSPACKPRFLINGQPIKRIFFLHMRKAGGTVIRKYLKHVSEKYNLAFQAREGHRTVEDPMDSATLYVANLRQPVARALSHYKYDQRWACTDLKNESFVPTNDNNKSSLEDFLVNEGNKSKIDKALWSCASNCYTRWATGNFQKLAKTCSNKLRRHEVERITEARDMLFKYNLIVITEKLREDNYIRHIEAMFGVPGLAQKQAFPACAKKSQAANKQVPLMLSNKTLQKIVDCNTPDSVLYAQLTTCPQGFEFPKYDKSFFS